MSRERKSPDLVARRQTVNIREVVGGGYGGFWRFRGRYRVCKGSRASKKSKTTALNLVYRMMRHPEANTLVIRKVGRTLKDSCFADLKWAAARLQVTRLWKFTQSPLTAEFLPTGQQILFRGLDDPMKLSSISVPVGCLCWVWIEEAYEITEEDFDMVDDTVRGAVPEGLYKQLTLTFNPWSGTSWLKRRFFDVEDTEDKLSMTTNYLCNEWLEDSDRRRFEDMRLRDPERYRVAGSGDWGVDGGLYFSEFREALHVEEPFRIPEYWTRYRCIDYGLDMLACLWVAVDERGVGHVYREFCQSGLVIRDAAAGILRRTLPGESIQATFAPPDLWARSKDTGRVVAEVFMSCGVNFVKAGNDRVRGHLLIKDALAPDEDGLVGLRFFSCCQGVIHDLQEITADEKDPDDCAKEPHEVTHTVDALRYFCVSRTLRGEAPPPEKPEDGAAVEYDDFLTGHEPGRGYLYP